MAVWVIVVRGAFVVVLLAVAGGVVRGGFACVCARARARGAAAGARAILGTTWCWRLGWLAVGGLGPQGRRARAVLLWTDPQGQAWEAQPRPIARLSRDGPSRGAWCLDLPGFLGVRRAAVSA